MDERWGPWDLSSQSGTSVYSWWGWRERGGSGQVSFPTGGRTGFCSSEINHVISMIQWWDLRIAAFLKNGGCNYRFWPTGDSHATPLTPRLPPPCSHLSLLFNGFFPTLAVWDGVKVRWGQFMFSSRFSSQKSQRSKCVCDRIEVKVSVSEYKLCGDSDGQFTF